MAAALAALFVVIFVSRGRAFADKRQAVALVCGAAAAVCRGDPLRLHTPPGSSVALIWGTVVLIGFAAAVLVSALLVPMTRFTPLVRMVAEWVELYAIVAAFPLAAWVGGLFTWVSNAMSRPAALSEMGRMSAALMMALVPNFISDVPAAQAIPQPSIDPSLVPPDGRPSPDQPMRQKQLMRSDHHRGRAECLGAAPDTPRSISARHGSTPPAMAFPWRSSTPA